jgi:hypothetical protein
MGTRTEDVPVPTIAHVDATLIVAGVIRRARIYQMNEFDGSGWI